MKNSNWLWIGLGAGSLVGLTVAALSSPWTGAHTRARLRRIFRIRPSEAEIDRAYDDVTHEARRMMRH